MVFEHGGVEGQPAEGEAKQTDPDVAQSAVRDEAEEPNKGKTFQGPAHGDPFAIKLDWENQGNKEQCGTGLPSQACVARCGISLALPDEKQRRDQVGRDEYTGR